MTQHESRKQAIGLFFVGSALLGLAHLCSSEMAEGTSLWMVYLMLIVIMYLFVTPIMWNNSVGVSVRKLTNEQVATEMERAKNSSCWPIHSSTEVAMNYMKTFPS